MREPFKDCGLAADADLIAQCDEVDVYFLASYSALVVIWGDRNEFGAPSSDDEPAVFMFVSEWRERRGDWKRVVSKPWHDWLAAVIATCPELKR